VELTYIVEANSEDEALMCISDGDVDPVDFNLIVNEQIDEITVEET
jgi:hypothetical protein